MDKSNLPTPAPNGALDANPIRFELADSEYGPEPGGNGAFIKRLLAAVRAYKWLILLVTAVGSGLGVLASRYVSPLYTAEATIWIEGADRNAASQGPIQSGELLQDNAWVELLRSYTVLDYVAEEKRLYLSHARRDADILGNFRIDSASARGQFVLQVDATGSQVTLSTADGHVVQRVAVGAEIGRDIGFIWQPPSSALTPGREVSFSVTTPRDAARGLNDILQTRKAERGNFVRLQYVGTDPELVAGVLNATADRYVAVAAELKKRKLVELQRILKSQLDYAEVNLSSAELALENFRVNTITLPSETATPVTPGLESTRAPVLSSYFQLKIEKDQIERDQRQVQRVLDSGDGISVDALSAVESVQQSPELTQTLQELSAKRANLRALSQLYTPEHPLVRRAQDELRDLEGNVIPTLTRNLVQELGTRIQALDQMVGSASSELREIPTRALDEARLTRSVDIAVNLYNDLRQRYENARLSAETAVADVSILDYAPVPQRPSTDERMRLILMAIVGSLGVGIALAVLLERADPKIRYAEQVSDGLHLTILGAIPELKLRRGSYAPEHRAALLEALRSIRLSLAHAYGSAGPMMITVSSPGPGDGKTFITCNLATTYADTGMRVLVIDGDTRRGTVHRVLDVERKPGLTDFLAGDLPIESLVRRTSNPNVDVIPCGTRLGNAPELLASPRMGELLAWIRPQYQVILIDSPPLGAGVDPLVLATLSGNILLVMRTKKTERAMAAAKLEMLTQLPIRILGAIVNGVNSQAGYKYYSYLPGYEAGQESREEPKLLQPS
jgi:capsular exopolysaccharide synthesis family protein